MNTEPDDLDRLIERLLELRKALPQGVKVYHHDCEWGMFKPDIVMARVIDENGNKSHHTDESIAEAKSRIEVLTDEQLGQEWDQTPEEERESSKLWMDDATREGWIRMRREHINLFTDQIAKMEAADLAIVLDGAKS